VSITNIVPPFPVFTDSAGAPLDNGFVYVGTANLNPVSNPIAVYWDAALTVVAAQPLRTINGYLSQSGSPGTLFSAVDYSITVKDSKGVQVFTAPSGARAGLGSIVLAATESLTAQAGASIVLQDGSTMTVGTATGTPVTVTMASNARIVGDVLPNVTGTQSLGSATRKWDAQLETATADNVVVNTLATPDAAGGASVGSNTLPFADVVARNARLKTAQIYGVDQPTVVGDLVELNQRVMILASMSQTSATATPTYVENYNCDTAGCSRASAGVHTIRMRVAPTGFAHPIVTVTSGGLGTGISIDAVISGTDITVRTGNGAGTGTDLRFAVTVIGYPTVADPIS